MKKKIGWEASGAAQVLVRPSSIELDACDGLGPTAVICLCRCFDICGT